jgi:predicted DsbA family dithiol-disulfide isomerase
MIKFAREKYGIESSRSNSVLFNALYEEGKNISLIDVLVQIGKDDLNLPDENELHEYIENGEGVSDVKR